jgi:hypothetical protein
MTNLNEIQGFNVYCGPGVLAALTGKSTDQCAAVISAITGQKVIKAVHLVNIIEAVRRLGFTAETIRAQTGSLFGLFRQLYDKPGFYIIEVPGHVVAIEVTDVDEGGRAIYLIDNHTKHAISAASSARLTQKVVSVYKVNPPRIPTKEELLEERMNWLHNEILQLTKQIHSLFDKRAEYERELASIKGR